MYIYISICMICIYIYDMSIYKTYATHTHIYIWPYIYILCIYNTWWYINIVISYSDVSIVLQLWYTIIYVLIDYDISWYITVHYDLIMTYGCPTMWRNERKTTTYGVWYMDISYIYILHIIHMLHIYIIYIDIIISTIFWFQLCPHVNINLWTSPRSVASRGQDGMGPHWSKEFLGGNGGGNPWRMAVKPNR
jgi:hypothetical protein